MVVWPVTSGATEEVGFGAGRPGDLQPIFAGRQNRAIPAKTCWSDRNQGETGGGRMAKLYLVDHSLRSAGDHHFDFAYCLARAAREMGFETILATHREFSGSPELDGWCEVRSSFQRSLYDSPSYLAGLERMQRRESPFSRQSSGSFWERTRRQWQMANLERRRRAYVEQFARDCEQLFAADTFEDDDHVLFTTVTELEVMAASAYLASHPRTLQVNWHWLFHFPVFEPPAAGVPRQLERLRQLKCCLGGARQSIPYHQAHFYGTTESLADQYRKLGLGPVERLVYPISERFAPESGSENRLSLAGVADLNSKGVGRPIRITCPGAIRREKGQKLFLQELIAEIGERDLASGRIEIELQSPPSKRRGLGLPSIVRRRTGVEAPARISPLSTQPALATATSSAGERSAAEEQGAIRFRDYPLSADEYAAMIRETDCGLLMYDSADYYVRRAGVLGELLAVGRPVIVSAGNWLSEQLKEAHFQYARRLAEGPLASRALTLADCRWDLSNVPVTGGVVGCDFEAHPFRLEFDLQADEGGAVLQFEWHEPESQGAYLRVDALGSGGELLSSQVIGHPENDSQAGVFVRFAPGQQVAQLQLRSAQPETGISLKKVRLQVLAEESRSLPQAVVGLIAADRSHLPLVIDELVNHYQHYRRTAEQFSSRWYAAHRPTAVIGRLLVAGESIRRAA